jgi:hypothetical protein
MEDVEFLRRRNAQLETRIDFLETQYARLDAMLVTFGFDEGIKTLAETLNEAIEIEKILRSEN